MNQLLAQNAIQVLGRPHNVSTLQGLCEQGLALMSSKGSEFATTVPAVSTEKVRSEYLGVAKEVEAQLYFSPSQQVPIYAAVDGVRVAVKEHLEEKLGLTPRQVKSAIADLDSNRLTVNDLIKDYTYIDFILYLDKMAAQANYVTPGSLFRQGARFGIVLYTGIDLDSLRTMFEHEYTHFLQYQSDKFDSKNKLLMEGHAIGTQRQMLRSRNDLGQNEYTIHDIFYFLKCLVLLGIDVQPLLKRYESDFENYDLSRLFDAGHAEPHALGASLFALAERREGPLIYPRALCGDFAFLEDL